MMRAMKTAARMDSIGTESAFEVSARARALEAAGRSIVYLQIGQPDFDTPSNPRAAAQAAIEAELVLRNPPADPAGGRRTRGDVDRIAEPAQRDALVGVSDEIYSRIRYDGAEHVSIASLPGMAARTSVPDGFSQTSAMTGWRLG